MDERNKTHDLSPKNLARLWDIGSDIRADGYVEGDEANERYSELLHDWMARPLPPGSDIQQCLPESVGQLCSTFQPFSGDSIGTLLIDSATPVTVLRQIKELAKDTGGATDHEVEREVALTVYFGAIASAMAFHGVHISQQDRSRVNSAFEVFSKRQGIPPALGAVFSQALVDARTQDGISQ